ncbi:LysR family transcriptional regulator [Amycolatopsis jejuensis]|uniref:LysR family transcriptional regulator n=1 Tax=Amycolatopsis jejuensis TaxID=330084 RepID=UPI000525175B|nr:LysR family transcriptional regulator [Amycolatopsis jejuensis]
MRTISRSASGVAVGMEIRQLRYFVAIVREGSFSRAARKLHLGQPALSKQIQALEHELGVELLLRVPDGIRPTEAGRRLEEMSRFLLGYVEDIGPAVRKAAAELAGTVTIGLSPSLVPALAGHVKARFAAEHPQLRIDIVEALPMFLCEWLDLGRLDAGIFTRSPPLDEMRRLSVTDLATDGMLLAAAPGTLPDRLRTSVPDDGLRSLPLALTPGFHHLVRDRLPPDSGPVLEIDSIHAIKDLVLRGEYCSALPYTFIRDDLAAGKLDAVPFAPPLRRQLVAVTRAGRRTSATVTAVITTARARLGELVAGCP